MSKEVEGTPEWPRDDRARTSKTSVEEHIPEDPHEGVRCGTDCGRSPRETMAGSNTDRYRREAARGCSSRVETTGPGRRPAETKILRRFNDAPGGREIVRRDHEASSSGAPATTEFRPSTGGGDGRPALGSRTCRRNMRIRRCEVQAYSSPPYQIAPSAHREALFRSKLRLCLDPQSPSVSD
jgi:hypothetical protein